MKTPRSDKPVIGIVGGIGAGKSTVAAEFGRLGCAVIDADAIGHGLLERDDVRGALRDRWGEAIFDGSGRVRREALAEAVFAGRGELDYLNRLLHPRIRAEMEAEIERIRRQPDVAAVVIDAAVLFEAAWDDLCTDLVFVEAPDETRAQRVLEQRGWNKAVWQEREKSQLPLDRKAARCLYHICSSSGVSHLRDRVCDLLHRIVKPADRS